AAGRTRAVAVAVVGAAALNGALNWALIPPFGLVGSAAATFVAYAALAVWTGVSAERVSRAHYPWRVPTLLSALVAGLWALSLPTEAWPLAGRLAARLGLLALFVPGLLALGVYGRADVDAGRGAVRAFQERRSGGSTP
ncbi:MAG TPA: polysaccharide biosynthesis C-terminal domain-containing protein, partial [Rubricoccaceae bacterium]